MASIVIDPDNASLFHGCLLFQVVVYEICDDVEVKTQLRIRAAQKGHSMEEEARRILREAISRKPRSRDFATTK